MSIASLQLFEYILKLNNNRGKEASKGILQQGDQECPLTAPRKHKSNK